jgi:hypothetical protein
VRRDCVRRPDNLQIDPLYGVGANEAMEPLIDTDRKQATLDAAGDSLLVEDLREPLKATNVVLNHSDPRLGRHRPKPLKRSIKLGLAEPEFPPDRPQAPAVGYRFRDLLVTFVLRLDCCAHVEASAARVGS